VSHTSSTDRVPLQGVATPVELVGNDPDELAALLTPAGMWLTVVGTEPGVATTRKLLRNTLVKGLSASACSAADWELRRCPISAR
jgi:3-hydroxyisobutyrate dehydrogenase-like beta-hydroxyacid dehydrogenase